MPLPILAGALVNLAINTLPSLVTYVAGDTAGTVATGIADAAKAVFQSDDAQIIEKALAADPAKLVEWQGKLLEVQDRESQRRHAERLAELQDVGNARSAFRDDKRVF